MRPIPVCLLLALVAAPVARADIYKYVDAQGNVNYTNLPANLPSKAERVVVERGSSLVPPPDPAAGTASGSGKARTAPTPGSFPRVDGDTQRKRDDQRRAILDNELQAEQRALDQSRQALAEGKEVRLGNERNYQKYLDRLKELQDAVDTHQANIDALQKEIGNLH